MIRFVIYIKTAGVIHIDMLQTSIPVQFPQPACDTGRLPCYTGCIDENKYCDFSQDCMPKNDDEGACRKSNLNVVFTFLRVGLTV